MTRSAIKLLIISVGFLVIILGVSSLGSVGSDLPTNSGDGIDVSTPDTSNNENNDENIDNADDRTNVVEQYTVTEIDGENNSITITAEIRDDVNTNGLSIRPEIPSNTDNIALEADDEQIATSSNRNIEQTLSSNIDQISYTFTFTSQLQNNQFISEQVVFLRQYGIQFTDKQYTAGTDSIQIGDNVEYNSLHTSESNIAIYQEETTVTQVTTEGHTTTVISPNTYDDTDELVAVENVSELFSGNRNNQDTTLFILPPENVRTGGFAIGHNDDTQTLWVATHSGYELRHTSMHEVVHAHQDFSTESDIEWFTEGSAEYVATLQMSEQIDNFDASLLEFNEDWYYREDSTEDVQLSEPSTWERNVEYNRGEHVTYLIDVSLRHHTDGETTIIDLMQWMNSQDSVSYAEFREYVVENTDEDFGNRLDYYTETTEIIDISEETERITGNETEELPDN